MINCYFSWTGWVSLLPTIGSMIRSYCLWQSNMKLVRISGITTGIGAFFGAIVGSISESVIAICLGFAAGAMLYIVSGELVPESNKLYKGRMSAIGNMLGFIIGIFATKL